MEYFWVAFQITTGILLPVVLVYILCLALCLLCVALSSALLVIDVIRDRIKKPPAGDVVFSNLKKFNRRVSDGIKYDTAYVDNGELFRDVFMKKRNKNKRRR